MVVVTLIVMGKVEVHVSSDAEPLKNMRSSIMKKHGEELRSLKRKFVAKQEFISLYFAVRNVLEKYAPKLSVGAIMCLEGILLSEYLAHESSVHKPFAEYAMHISSNIFAEGGFPSIEDDYIVTFPTADCQR